MAKSKNNYGNQYTNINTTLNGHSVNSSHLTVSNVSATIQPALTVSGNAEIKIEEEGNIILKDKDGTEYDVVEFIKTVSERMLVLHPNFQAHEQYPALKEAYEHYKFLEDLMLTGNKDAKKD